MSDRPIGLDIYRSALPMRSFEHAAASRCEAEAILLCLRTEAGRFGWGEALPRPYVTGETMESVRSDIAEFFWPLLARCRSADEVAQAVAALPFRRDGRIVTAARCAVELAAIAAFDLAWHCEPVAPLPAGPRRQPRQTHNLLRPNITGVLGSRDPGKTSRKLRLMWLYGLRHFKLKLGFDEDTDRANLQACLRRLGKPIRKGRCTLRVDVNGGWSYADVPARVAELKDLGACAVEQPVFEPPGRLAELAYDCALPLIADETCLTHQDAEVLLGAEGRVWLNIRIAKNGGLIPSLNLFRHATAERTPTVLGCMVGESFMLSSAQRVLLAAGVTPTMVEGNFGRFLLRDDLMRPSPRFGYGGRLKTPRKPAFHCVPRSDKMQRYARPLARLDL